MKQFMFKQDLAQVYFEGYDQEVARRLLAREIHGNAELMAELEATGYRRSQKRLSPKQVGIIERYLGSSAPSNRYGYANENHSLRSRVTNFFG